VVVELEKLLVIKDLGQVFVALAEILLCKEPIILRFGFNAI